MNFDLFPDSKYDEIFPAQSKKLAPIYTHSLPPLDDFESDDDNGSGGSGSAAHGRGRGGRGGGGSSSSSSHKRQQRGRQGDASMAGRAPVDGAVGLVNLGNTCYMASTLQSLSHTPLLRDYFVSGRYDLSKQCLPTHLSQSFSLSLLSL